MKPKNKKKESMSFGFDDEQPDGFVSDAEEPDTRRLVAEQNRKKKKSGGFQSMGFSNNVFKGITKRGYKVPTPIQRKVWLCVCVGIRSLLSYVKGHVYFHHVE